MYKILHKRRYYIVILLLALLALYYGCTYISFQDSEITPIIQNSTPLLEYECCTPLSNITMRKHIYFLKTHKTGSSTVQNIIFRFAERYSLDVMFLLYHLYHLPLSSASLWPDIITPNNKYHVMAYHMRYTSNLKLYQYPDTVMTTILRHPVTLFQSAYHFFHMQDYMGLTFQQFMAKPNKPKILQGINSFAVYRGYNQMSVDLGFDLKNRDNKTAINEFIKKIDEEFDYVMIMEYMEASMVLLANLMGWPLEYVVHLKTNARPVDSNSYVLTEQDKSTLLELNHIDALLYHHFLQKFRECVRQYGADELGKEILKLEKMNKQLEEKCVAETNYNGLNGAVNYVPKNATDWECDRAVKLQAPYEFELHVQQIGRIHGAIKENSIYQQHIP